MKVFHVRYCEPIGPSWIAYLKPPLVPTSKNIFLMSWIEEIELNKLTQEFMEYVIAEREKGINFNCLLEIRN